MRVTELKYFILILAAASFFLHSCSDDDPCDGIDCLNGGACVEGTCECPDGFSGVRCETEDRCITQNIDCLNGGTCEDGTCDCPEGFTGTRCENIDLEKIQALLDRGITPKTLVDAGVAVEELYGKLYEGGHIFYLNESNGTGLLAATALTARGEWGCFQSQINGADGTAIGTGAQNTIDIIAGCAQAGIAARLCDQMDLNGKTDWFMPSKDELNLMHKNLHLNGFGGFTAGVQYWSSSESNMNNRAWFQVFDNFGSQFEGPKEFSRNVHPIRAF